MVTHINRPSTKEALSLSKKNTPMMHMISSSNWKKKTARRIPMRMIQKEIEQAIKKKMKTRSIRKYGIVISIKKVRKKIWKGSKNTVKKALKYSKKN